MENKIIDKGYKFVEKGHCHYLNGERLTGCTTILSILAKPALIQWSANMASMYIEEEVRKIAKENDGLGYIKKFGEEWARILIEAKSAHRKKKETAGDWGTIIHKWIESYLKGKKPEPLKEEKQELACGNFVKWIDDNKVKFLESEKHLYSEKLFIGGIVDLIVEIDGKVWIADIKTGSGIYFEAFWQMAGYQIMLEEMNFDKPITGHIVLNFTKDGKFNEKRSISNEDNKKGFLACLEIYRICEKIKNQIIS